MHGLDRLFHKVADEHTLAVGYRAERRYEPRCAHAAEAASRLGKQDLGAQARAAQKPLVVLALAQHRVYRIWHSPGAERA